ncbi:flagellar biosynthesis protein FlhA [Parvularcula sp. LCG005]|uniref:flagellar biosynthesis protein FlhA n=1 Tax=Parvularcula sp. LCG005 TaxID=3078805 RepID=UPI002941FB24|nr:flagellar biosynthesis protein FlhA [Parvularcula sp. LCG005]WOI52942.1 flagellar biosynthesis protein FlhA [Parvularcula sp. LCG005]
MDGVLKTLRLSPTIGLAVGLMGILIMMILPVPPMLLDIGLMLSFAFAILIFTVTLFVQRPLDFSSFPAILLVSLLLRLSLNISSTKLIIGEGHTGADAAGGVIEGFAMFIMGGNLGLGLIVFTVLIIVNFLVITKGAGRMAEVGARFALDAMPGKQMAIDADVAAGAISHEEAKRLRQREQEETAFLGSLDGASKFVKGDAIAGLLITLLNLVAGIGIGMVVHGISFQEALENYSILTVGDGLVSQIPAVIISVAAALLLSKGRGEGAVDHALLKELGTKPEALGTVAVAMVIFGSFPGLPVVPFYLGAIGLGYLAWRAYRYRPAEESLIEEPLALPESDEPSFGDLLDIDDIHVELSSDLVRTVIEGESGLNGRVEKIRRYVIQEYGFIMPPVRVTDRQQLHTGSYEIKVHGVTVARNGLQPGRFLALIAENAYPELKGDSVKEPVYGAAARWVDQRGKDKLILNGVTVVDPVEVLSTHLLETVQVQFPKLMTRRAMRAMIDAFTKPSDAKRAEANRRLVDDLVPEKVPHDLLQQVLRELLAERVSVRNLALILEAIAEARSAEQKFEGIVEHVRRRLAFQFVSKLASPDGKLAVIQLGDQWEKALQVQGENDDGRAQLPGQTLSRLIADLRKTVDQAASGGTYPVIAINAARRRFLRSIMASHGMTNPVFSFDEIATHATPQIVGTV